MKKRSDEELVWSDALVSVQTLTHLHVLGREASEGLQEMIRLITL